MTPDELRHRYLTFFQKNSHAVIPSAPLVPQNDPTTLFIGSGMQPLMPYLLGETHPAGRRVTDSQKSFRSEDIEEVGDNRHTTFFEMLGNWSLGDYFKKEQLRWFFTFLTNAEVGLGLDPNKLYVSVFYGDKNLNIPRDDDSVKIWQELFSEENIEAKDVVLLSEKQGSELGMQGGRISASNMMSALGNSAIRIVSAADFWKWGTQFSWNTSRPRVVLENYRNRMWTLVAV